VSIAFLIPLIVLGSLILLMGTMVGLGRFRGGRYLRPIVTWMSRVPVLKTGIKKMSMAAIERENPELARALRKMETFGTPKNPDQAQRALALLTPAERRAYMDAVGKEVEMPEPTNRAQRRRIDRGVQPGVMPTPRPVGRKKRR
jgi:hypothetical protein